MATAKKEVEEIDNDRPQTEVIIPPGTKANIIENINGKRVSYEGEVKVKGQAENGFEESGDNEDLDSELYQNQIENFNREDQNTIEYFFECLDHFRGEALRASVKRLPDSAGDNFNVPCYEVRNFGFIAFRPEDIFTFLPRLQGMNGNSGGRFHIEAYHNKTGRPLDISLQDFVIENPERKEETQFQQIQRDDSTSELTKLLMMQMQKSDERFEKLMLEMHKPKEDEFMQLIKQKMVNEFLNPQKNEPATDPVANAVAGMLGSVAVMEKVGEAMGDMFQNKLGNGNGNNEKPSLLDRAMDNPQIINAGLNMATNLTNGVISIADSLAKQKGELAANQNTPASQQTVDAEFTDIPAQPQPQQNPAQPQPLQNIPQGTKEEMISELMAELEGDSAIDRNNVFLLKTLPEKFQMQATMIFAACRGNNDFEQVFEMMEAFIPSEIMDRYEITDPEDENEVIFNELGMKVKERLREVYDLIRAN